MSFHALVDGTPLDTEHRFRGVGSYVKGLLRGFEEIGYGFRALRQFRRLGFYGRTTALTPASAAIVRPPRPRLRFDWVWNEVWLRKEIESLSASFYHATDLAGIPISTQFRTIATVYDLIPLAFPQYFGELSLDQRLGYRTSLKRLRQACHLIAISEFTKRDVVSRLGIDPEHITAIPLGVNLENFAEPSKETVKSVRDRYQLPERYLLYVGALEAHKRIPMAVAAAAHARVPLVIAGRHACEQQRLLAETVLRLHAGSLVWYLGYVPGEDLPALYKNARAFVFPSVYEGFGLPVLEAMAARCPVVTTSAASLPEVAGDAAIVLAPDNLEALVGAVSEITENENLRLKLIEAGAARVRSFTWEKTAQRTVEVYERVVGGKL